MYKANIMKFTILIADVALYKNASQSSTLEYPAHYAVDGNKNTDLIQNSCAHTQLDKSPWWEVDLGKKYDITGVEITNRGDCCGERLKDFNITVDSNL